jgi:hypothetical protein
MCCRGDVARVSTFACPYASLTWSSVSQDGRMLGPYFIKSSGTYLQQRENALSKQTEKCANDTEQ